HAPSHSFDVTGAGDEIMTEPGWRVRHVEAEQRRNLISDALTKDPSRERRPGDLALEAQFEMIGSLGDETAAVKRGEGPLRRQPDGAFDWGHEFFGPWGQSAAGGNGVDANMFAGRDGQPKPGTD